MNATKIIHTIPSDLLTSAISVPMHHTSIFIQGAGKEVTVRGVFLDILKLSNQLN